MRDIKFRAKDIESGEWVYGDLISGECTYISTNDNFYNAVVSMSGRMSTTVNVVDGDTVGQFTGCKDKIGHDIYEGDIVKLSGVTSYSFGNEIDIISFIEYNNMRASFECENITDFRGADKIEIIGNVHENPELLNEN